MTKVCTKCKIEQLCDCFSKDKNKKDGLQSNCKTCIFNYRQKNKELKHLHGYIILSSLKVCSKCKVEQPIECFSKQSLAKDGLRSNCKKCAFKYQQDNKYHEYLTKKQYRSEHREEICKSGKKYYIANKDKIIKQVKQYVLGNKEKVAITKHLTYMRNRKEILQKQRAYFNTPKGKAVQKNIGHKRRALLKKGNVTSEQMLELINTATNCFWCEIDIRHRSIHIDHLVPLSKGGEHSLYNLVVSCPTCNLRKGTKDILEFAKIIFKEEIK